MDKSTADTSRRFREQLARREIRSDSEAARLMGVDQQWLSRRLTGATDWKISELHQACTALGLSYDYIATGHLQYLDDEPPKARGATSRRAARKERIAARDAAWGAEARSKPPL